MYSRCGESVEVQASCRMVSRLRRQFFFFYQDLEESKKKKKAGNCVMHLLKLH